MQTSYDTYMYADVYAWIFSTFMVRYLDMILVVFSLSKKSLAKLQRRDAYNLLLVDVIDPHVRIYGTISFSMTRGMQYKHPRNKMY